MPPELIDILCDDFSGCKKAVDTLVNVYVDLLVFTRIAYTS